MKKSIKILTAGMLLLALIGCGKSAGITNELATDTGNAYQSSKSSMAVMGENGDMASDTEEIVQPDTESADTTQNVQVEEGTDDTQKTTDRKLIRTVSLDAETKKFDSFSTNLEKMISNLGGYIEYSDISGESDAENRYATYTIRVPEDKLEEFLKGMDENLNVTRHSESVEDVTLNYVDTQSHINSLKAEQDTLNAMIASATTIDELISIQDRLSEIRYQLESYESQLRTYDNQINYSTVNLTVQEVEKETPTGESSFGTKLKQKFAANVTAIKKGFSAFVLWFLSSIPYFLIIAVIVGIVVLICKKLAKHSETRTQRKIEKESVPKIENTKAEGTHKKEK